MTERTRVLHTVAELHEAVSQALNAFDPNQRSLGLVPTMGALHAGHQALASAAVENNSVSVASIFVNPLQFGDTGDLDRYPRTLDADLDVLGAAGVDFAFAPELDQVYPNGEPSVRITSGELGNTLEGASRPGHFDGALTVVAKLLHLVQPRVQAGFRAYFGQKDAQQLALMKLMVADLNFPVEIVPVPTVRDADGLALSSRNTFLDAEHRSAALSLSRALRLLASAAAAGETLPLDEARQLIAAEPLAELDYLEILDARTFRLAEVADGATAFSPRYGKKRLAQGKTRSTPVGVDGEDGTHDGEAPSQPLLAVVAAKVGPVRLIDNMLLQ